jgi:hypothetical protein
MRALLILLLLLAAVPSSQAAAARPIVVTFVTPPGETTTEDEMQQGVRAVEAAVQWWQEVYADTPPTRIEVAGVFPAPNNVDVYREHEWIGAASNIWRIYLVDNSESKRRFTFENAEVEGFAYQGYTASVVLTGDWQRPAAIAHELGHVFFSLPDTYTFPVTWRCPEVDLMCNPDQAYVARTLGCRTRANLGAPCRQVWLPLMYAPSQPLIPESHRVN